MDCLVNVQMMGREQSSVANIFWGGGYVCVIFAFSVKVGAVTIPVYAEKLFCCTNSQLSTLPTSSTLPPPIKTEGRTTIVWLKSRLQMSICSPPPSLSQCGPYSFHLPIFKEQTMGYHHHLSAVGVWD